MSNRRIAMWSGPRNISTAMMRAFENRPDATVIDEPFYACYLAATRLDHPGRDEIIRRGLTDWQMVADCLTGPIPDGKAIWYQKQMTHHMLPRMGRDWMLHEEFTHAFLIRSPRQVLSSLAKVLTDIDLTQTGYPQQVELWEWLAKERGARPVVIETDDILRDPRGLLTRLCDALSIDFVDAMLRWPPGPRPTDGCWAKDWYARVEQSTTFAAPNDSSAEVPACYQGLLDACQPLYDQLARYKL